MPVPHTVARASDLNADLIRLVSEGRNLSVGPQLAREVGASCAAARRALDRGGPVYGVNTGMGALSGVTLSAAEQREHQRNLLAGRAAGGPPWLPEADVRALFAVRLRTFLNGDAGVSPQLCRRLAEFLNLRIVPAVPATAAGSAGEIVPLAHAFGPVAGIGQVLAAANSGAANSGELIPAAEALGRHGLAPFELGPKEGIALLQGVPGATALAVLASGEAAATLALLEAAAGLAIAAAGAPADPYHPALARGDAVLGAVHERLRALAPAGPPRMLQAPVSFRVAGHTLAQVARAAGGLAGAAGRALDGVTDSPAFADGQFLGTGGFDGIDIAAAADHLTAVTAHAAEVSAARMHRLLDPRVTGLPAQLAARPGPDAGLVTVHKRAAGEVHALRRLAVPSALGTIETSAGQEDVQSFAWAAVRALRAALRHARLVAAAELLTAWQAAALRGPDWAAGGAGPLRDRIAGLIAPVTADRPFGPDIERLADPSWLAGPE